MTDSHDSPRLLPSDTLSPPRDDARRFDDAYRFDDAHPYRTPSGRRRLLDERRHASLALERAEQAATERKRLRKELAHLDELLRVRSERAIEQITVRTKCRQRWDRMTPTDEGLGADAVRRCDRCHRDVFDLSKMTEEEIETRVTKPGTPLTRLHRRSDGRVVTAPCPPRDKVPLFYGIGAAAGGAMLASSLFATSQLGAMDRRAATEPVRIASPVHAPAPVDAAPAREAALRSTPEDRPSTAAGELAPMLQGPLVRPGDIRSLGRRAWQVRRSFVNRMVARGSVVRGLPAQAVPHEENGRVVGVRIDGVRPDGVWGRLGLRNGDMLISANGYSLTQPDSAMDAFTRLRRGGVSRVSLRIRRDGTDRVLVYRITARAR